MSNNNYFHSIYDPTTQSVIQIPFTEEEIAKRILEEEENTRINSELEWKSIRKKRDESLLKCDWTQLPNAPLSQSKKDEWETYRQALRDLPSNITNVYNVNWPIPPA